MPLPTLTPTLTSTSVSTSTSTTITTKTAVVAVLLLTNYHKSTISKGLLVNTTNHTTIRYKIAAITNVHKP